MRRRKLSKLSNENMGSGNTTLSGKRSRCRHRRARPVRSSSSSATEFQNDETRACENDMASAASIPFEDDNTGFDYDAPNVSRTRMPNRHNTVSNAVEISSHSMLSATQSVIASRISSDYVNRNTSLVLFDRVVYSQLPCPLPCPCPCPCLTLTLTLTRVSFCLRVILSNRTRPCPLSCPCPS